MGASDAQAIAANGKGLESCIREKMREYFSANGEQGFTNSNMENGIELEATAAMLYEFKTGLKTHKVGYVIHSPHVGCSPDRAVGQKGLIEIKCPTNKVYFDLLLDNIIDTKYQWQMQMQLLICKREWCDYVVYNPNFADQLVIIRVEPDEEKFKKLEVGFEACSRRIKEILYRFERDNDEKEKKC
jgi:exodeoxyribonuclease (lambda-induced)